MQINANDPSDTHISAPKAKVEEIEMKQLQPPCEPISEGCSSNQHFELSTWARTCLILRLILRLATSPARWSWYVYNGKEFHSGTRQKHQKHLGIRLNRITFAACLETPMRAGIPEQGIKACQCPTVQSQVQLQSCRE